ncbi:hypothetical protein RhiirB3_402673 [Rhizophagus irregularis]|nr:hypothetical protein RhiirB3_402673 [Rhizophagus irregularis]
MAGSLSYVELGVIHKISGGERKYLQTAYPKPKILMSYLFSFTHIFCIKLITYSIIALAGIYRLASNWSVSRFNWEHPINGGPNILAYSSSILLIMFSYDGWNTLNCKSFNNSISVGIVTLMYLFVNIAFISVVPQESISNNNNIDETIAATFFYRLFGKSVVVFYVISTFSMYSYWIFYFVTGIGLLLIRQFDMNDKEFDMNDKELNENSSLFSNITQEYKIPLPFAIIFILAGLFILVFSFVVNVECPKDKPNCDLREKTAQQLAPILISYGFLFVALTCWYSFYYWWGSIKDQREAAVMRIADENEKPYDFN